MAVVGFAAWTSGTTWRGCRDECRELDAGVCIAWWLSKTTPSLSARSSASSACDVGGETSVAVGCEETIIVSTSCGTRLSVWNAGGDAYELWPSEPAFSGSVTLFSTGLEGASDGILSIICADGAAMSVSSSTGRVSGDVLSCLGLFASVPVMSSFGRGRFAVVIRGLDRSWALIGSIRPCSSCTQRR